MKKIGLTVRFCSPLLLDNFTLVSRPCTYIDLTVHKKTPCNVHTDFLIYSDLVQRGDDRLVGGSNRKAQGQDRAAFGYAFMGRAAQRPLGNSGDNITIDWGYAYLASDDEKAVLFELYCKLVNYFGPSVGFELSVVCCPADMAEYRQMLAIAPQGDAFDEIRKEYSDMLVEQVSKSRYERRICLTYTIEADNVKQARSRLGQIDSDVVGHFRALMVTARPMDGYEPAGPAPQMPALGGTEEVPV